MGDVALIFTLLILLAIVVLCFSLAIKAFKMQGKKKAEMNTKKTDLNALEYVTLKHTVGLPLPENTLCEIFYSNEKLVIEGGGSTFNLSFEKVIDITLKTDVEIQKSFVSSAGGAVAGGLLFGPLGALVGGRTKQKQSKEITNYFIVTYDKNVSGNPEYIAFDATGNLKVVKILSLYNKLPKATREAIEL